MNMMGNMGKPAQASPMMFEMMMRRKGMTDRFVRPGGVMPENAAGLAGQAQMMADQYSGAVEAQRAMGGAMAPQPMLGGLTSMAAQMAADPQVVAAQEAMQMQAAGPRTLPNIAGGRPGPRLRQARGKMATKRARGRMTPMAGRRRKRR